MPKAQSCLLRFGGNACLDGAVTYVGAARYDDPAMTHNWRMVSLRALGPGRIAVIHNTLRVAFLEQRPYQSFQKSRKRAGESSVYRTVCWMFLCPR